MCFVQLLRLPVVPVKSDCSLSFCNISNRCEMSVLKKEAA